MSVIERQNVDVPTATASKISTTTSSSRKEMNQKFLRCLLAAVAYTRCTATNYWGTHHQGTIHRSDSR